VFLHFVSEAQKFFVLRLLRTGNPNYLGEVLICVGFAVASRHWQPALVLAGWFLYFVRNMRRKTGRCPAILISLLTKIARGCFCPRWVWVLRDPLSRFLQLRTSRTDARAVAVLTSSRWESIVPRAGKKTVSGTDVCKADCPSDLVVRTARLRPGGLWYGSDCLWCTR
jgi:hypothetical protein